MRTHAHTHTRAHIHPSLSPLPLYPPSPPTQSLNTQGGDPDIEAKSSLATMETIFRAEILDRYPETEYAAQPFPAGVERFCLPYGLRLKQKEELPTFFTFVSTGGGGGHQYGHCLSFPELLSPAQMRYLRLRSFEMGLDEELPPELYAPKCLCLLTTEPFIDACRKFLTTLYRLSISPLELPIERYICNFVVEVPMPPPGRVKVRAWMGGCGGGRAA